MMKSDTHPKMEELQVKLMREAPSWKKAAMVGEMYRAMITLSLSGLRARHPAASEGELRRRLADLVLGPELANRVYGPLEASLERVDAP